MNKDRLNELLSIALGLMSVLAIIGLLINNKFDTNEVLGSVVNFTQVAIPVLVLLVATTLNRRTKTPYEVGKDALKKVQKKHKDILIGPRYNRDEESDKQDSKALEYLFIIKPNTKMKAKFSSTDSLYQGAFPIYVQKSTLVYGLNYLSENATAEEIKKIKKVVRETLDNFLNNKYKGYFELIETKKEDTAILIDFYEEEMGRKKFAKAIEECSEIALQKILSFKK